MSIAHLGVVPTGERPQFATEPPPGRKNPFRLSAERLRNGTLARFSSLVARVMEAEKLCRRAASHRVAESHPHLYVKVLEILE